MDKKTILAALACVAVFVGGQFIIAKIWPPVPVPTPPATPATTNASPAVAVTNAAASAVTTNTPVAATAISSAPSGPLPNEQFATLQNEFVRVKLTSWGGGIRAVELLKYNADHGGHVTLNADAPEPVLALVGAGGTNTAYELEQSSSTNIVMRARLAGGIEVVKTLALIKDYVLTGKVWMATAPAQPVQLAVGTAFPATDQEGQDFLGVDWLAGNYQTQAFSKILKKTSKGERGEKTPARWLGVKNQFFAVIVTPATNAGAIQYGTVHPPQPSDWKGKTAYEGVSGALELPLTKNADGSWSQEFSVYAGPKEYRRLAALGAYQEDVMDFGLLILGGSSFLSVWLLQSMIFLHKLIPNYGIAIILITIAIKIIFWPLSAKQMKSMKEMQKFQPMVAKLKEKYKDDPKRQQQEMMRLYKEHKINPVAGCLPMLAQIPVFFALFNMLRSAVELRGAGFLWISDLSRPDTIFSIAGLGVNPLPLAMTASMIWQQKITPATGDAQQQKIMMFMMPVMMLFFLYNASSGLTLYWTVQQLLSIGQQWWSLRQQQQPVVVPAVRSK